MCIRDRVTTVYTRLVIKPVPDFENPTWQAMQKRIKNDAPKRDPKETARPPHPRIMQALEDLVIEGSLIEAVFSGFSCC